MKNGVTTIATPRVASHMGRHKSSVKDVMSTPRKIHASRSDANLKQTVGHTTYNLQMRRNSSDNSFTDSTKKYSKNVKNNNINNNNNNKIVPKNRTQVQNVNGLRKYSSTLGLDTKVDVNSDVSNPETYEHYESDDDNDKSQRVLQWIIGVSDAEPPEEPLIEHVDEPPQRDTAIRIVYDGDSWKGPFFKRGPLSAFRANTLYIETRQCDAILPYFINYVKPTLSLARTIVVVASNSRAKLQMASFEEYSVARACARLPWGFVSKCCSFKCSSFKCWNFLCLPIYLFVCVVFSWNPTPTNLFKCTLLVDFLLSVL